MSERSACYVTGSAGAVCCLAMHYENDGTPARRWRCYLAILLAVVYGALTGSKGLAVTLVLSLMFLSFMQRGTVRFAALAWVVSVGVVCIRAEAVCWLIISTWMQACRLIQYLRSWQRQFRNTGWVDWLRLIALWRCQQSLESVQTLSRFFLETANALGGRFEIPSIHAEYTPCLRVQGDEHYTIYFSYFKDSAGLA